MFEPIRGGTRGGQAEFKWSDVSADKDREVNPIFATQFHFISHSYFSTAELSRTQYQCADRTMAKEQGRALV